MGQQPELILPHSMFPVVNQPDRLEVSSSEASVVLREHQAVSPADVSDSQMENCSP